MERIQNAEGSRPPTYEERKAAVRRNCGEVSDAVLDVYGELTKPMWALVDAGQPHEALAMLERAIADEYPFPEKPVIEITEEYWARQAMDPLQGFGNGSN